jgi:hypothetical protein
MYYVHNLVVNSL